MYFSEQILWNLSKIPMINNSCCNLSNYSSKKAEKNKILLGISFIFYASVSLKTFKRIKKRKNAQKWCYIWRMWCLFCTVELRLLKQLHVISTWFNKKMVESKQCMCRWQVLNFHNNFLEIRYKYWLRLWNLSQHIVIRRIFIAKRIQKKTIKR